MSTMFDAANAAAIPTSATLAAGYIDGHYQSYPEIVARCPKAFVVPITTTGVPVGRVCDVESGNLTPVHGASWALWQVQRGRRPTIYCSMASWTACTLAVGAVGLRATDVDWWIAHWTGTPHLLAGSVATQWAGNVPGATPGTLYDESETNGVWPYPIPPTPEEATRMGLAVIETGDGKLHVYGVTTGGDLAEWVNDTRNPKDPWSYYNQSVYARAAGENPDPLAP